MKRGEIWLVDLDPSFGHEQRGKRPVLVVSTADFAKVTGVALICPISGGANITRDAGFAVSLSGAGTRTTGVVIASQCRTVDLRARQGRRVEVAPDFIVDEVLARLRTIID